MTQVQIDLEGKEVKQPKAEEKPWKGICCKACWFAKGAICRCRCHKENHGKGRRQILREVESGVSEDRLLPEEEAREFRKQYRDVYCLCGTDLSHAPISYYVPHDGGWTIQCEKQKAWLFVTCPNKKCGYQMSIWKMGVKRE